MGVEPLYYKTGMKTAFHESYLYRGLCSHLNIIVIEIRFFCVLRGPDIGSRINLVSGKAYA